MVEQQLNGGTWMTLVASTQANTYLVTSLTNNTTYSFRIRPATGLGIRLSKRSQQRLIAIRPGAP